jgi:hypothetical protein
MRWISSRWSIEASLVGVALILALTIAWHNKNAVQKGQLSEHESSARGDSNLRESGPDLENGRAELTRVTREIAALRAELERLAAMRDTTMAQDTAVVDEAESTAPLSSIRDHEVDPETMNTEKTAHIEAKAAEEVNTRKEQRVDRVDAMSQQGTADDSDFGGSASLDPP